ncbi:hypothetical protein HPB48_021236 [Haemaphysalis longicornis]|uniref:Cuticle protein n=1 Tax=Haemaphysalis longicornis TaxID=44386 RepID=A0A9J6G9Q3_HAELO|nr:hypothetical protein HPB48_021236 [Haemaphysalis longicornis]
MDSAARETRGKITELTGWTKCKSLRDLLKPRQHLSSSPWQLRSALKAHSVEPIPDSPDSKAVDTAGPPMVELQLLDTLALDLTSFGYDNTDEYGTRLFHNEQSDANNARTGSYGYRDAYGIFRTVRYVADANGFRATIDTNEPGTLPGASADAVFNANPVAAPPGAQYGAGRYGGSAGYAGGAPYGGYGSRGPWAG